jgi:ABC-type uncharacterized transport system involved in gliding motility auxiliary subunit
MNGKLISFSGLVGALLLFLSLNIISNQTLTSARIDLTENDLYTLSQGTKNILSQLEERITLKFYFSSKQLSGLPQLLNYGNRVRDLLEEYEVNSNGKIRLVVIDPAPFSEAEDEAVSFGIRQLPLNANGNIAYLGLVGSNTVDDRKVMEVLSPEQEDGLEYELTKMIYQLSEPEKRLIGVLSGLSVFAPPADPRTGQTQGTDWTAITLLKEFHEVREISSEAKVIDSEIDTLVVIHPKKLSELTQFAIEQFLLSGGKAIFFIDPLAEEDRTPSNPETPGVMPQLSSNLESLLASWGISLDTSKVVGDPSTAVRVNFSTSRGGQEVEYLPWIQLQGDSLNKADFTTNQLNSVNFGTAGSLEIKEKIGLNYTILIKATKSSGLLESDSIISATDPSSLTERFVEDELQHILALKVTGEITSAFLTNESTIEKFKTEAALKESSNETTIIVVADTDVLADRFWVRFSNFSGIRMPEAFGNNGDFLVNAVDTLSGNNDLISLRSRGTYTRPFKVVQEIRRKAEGKFREREQELLQKLKTAEENLAGLQSQDANGEFILTEEQKSEIEAFREEQIQTRKDLRSVQHDLQSSIDKLRSTVTFLNTAMVPLLLSLLVAFASYRRARKSRVG